MIVVSDTTAITTLLKAGMEDLLVDLFERIVIPKEVCDELIRFHAALPGFVLVRPMMCPERRLPETASLGEGEAAAITLAKEISADLFLTDDLKARRIAASMNIRCMGLLGLLMHGKRRGHVLSVRESIGILETRGGLYLSEGVKAEALELAGEVD